MASETFTNRNRLIAGLAIVLVLLTLIIYSVIRIRPRGVAGPQVGHRSPAETLTYCGAEQNKLCIVAFSQEVDGSLQVNFETPYAFYPEFILTINHNGEESTYECQRVEATSTGVVCTGKPQVPGEVMEFKVISKYWGTVFAEGRFAIIGIALFTPGVESTGTLEAPTELVTQTLEFVTPTPIPTATRRTPTPSYPNPSYP
jgi:hypothetical protein